MTVIFIEDFQFELVKFDGWRSVDPEAVVQPTMNET